MVEHATLIVLDCVFLILFIFFGYALVVFLAAVFD
jgi:hypothetical protein